MLTKKKYLFSLILFLAFCFSSCDSYQKLLKSNDLNLKLEKAKMYYNKGDYVRALPLFEELVNVYKGTKDIEEIYFHFAYCYYGQADFLIAGYHFKNFYTSYPKSKFAEESQYMFVYCYYLLSPKFSLDQTYTGRALEGFQLFINTYPNSEKVASCNEMMDELRRKLEKKALYSANLYYKMGEFRAAAISFKILIREFPDTPDSEKIHLLILKSYFQFAQKSILSKKQERFELSINAYKDFKDKFPESKFQKEAESIYQTCIESIKKIESNEN